MQIIFRFCLLATQQLSSLLLSHSMHTGVRPCHPAPQDGSHRAEGGAAGEGVLRQDLACGALPQRQICRREQIPEHHWGRLRSQGTVPTYIPT